MKKSATSKLWYMSRGERNGVLLFFFLSVILIITFRMLSIQEDRVTIRSLPGAVDKQNNTSTNYKKKHQSKNTRLKSISSKIKKRKNFYFNPNTISMDSLVQLGFSKQVATNILKYRTKGGKIKSIEHFKKIYGIDTNLVQSLAEYVHFDQTKPSIEKQSIYNRTSNQQISSDYSSPIRTEISPVELNQADSLALVAIKGIGPYYAKKIIKTRQRLGGYATVEQLLECQVLPDSVYKKIVNRLIADPDKMEKININKANFITLIKHPFMSENLVKVILQYRENHGAFRSLQQLKNIKILTKERYDKIIPHFTVDE